MRSSPKRNDDNENILIHFHEKQNHDNGDSSMVSIQGLEPKTEEDAGDRLALGKEIESSMVVSPENLNNDDHNVGGCWEKSSNFDVGKMMKIKKNSFENCENDNIIKQNRSENNINNNNNNNNNPPLSFLEKWLLDDTVVQVEEMMSLSPMF